MFFRAVAGRVRILIDGNFVSCVCRGKGEKIVLLHGYLSCKESFYYQTEFLSSSGFEVTAFDFPGFGGSAPIERPWSVGDYAEWFLRFLNSRKITRAHILAHSFGARVAFKAVSGHPNIASSLIVTGGAGIVKPRGKDYERKVRAYRRVKKLFPLFAEKHFGSPEYRTLPPVMRESYKLIVNEDLRSCASRVACRTYLLYGESDRVTPPDEEGKIFHSLIAGSRFDTLEGGHFCFSEHPEAFNAKIYGFLTEK